MMNFIDYKNEILEELTPIYLINVTINTTVNLSCELYLFNNNELTHPIKLIQIIFKQKFKYFYLRFTQNITKSNTTVFYKNLMNFFVLVFS